MPVEILAEEISEFAETVKKNYRGIRTAHVIVEKS